MASSKIIINKSSKVPNAPSNDLWAQLEVDNNNPTATDDIESSLNRLVGMDTYYPFKNLNAAITYANTLLINGVVSIGCISTSNDSNPAIVERNSNIEVYFGPGSGITTIINFPIENYGKLQLDAVNSEIILSSSIINFDTLKINRSTLVINNSITNKSKLTIYDSYIIGSANLYPISLENNSFTDILFCTVSFQENADFIQFEGTCTLNLNCNIASLNSDLLYFARSFVQYSNLYIYLTLGCWNNIYEAENINGFPLYFSKVTFNSDIAGKNNEWYPAYTNLPNPSNIINNRSKVKTFKGFLTQTSVSVPEARVVENLIGYYELGRLGVGGYFLITTGSFTNNTIVKILDNTEEMRFIFKANVIDSNTIQILTAEYEIVDGSLVAVPLDGLLHNSPITIEVYPE